MNFLAHAYLSFDNPQLLVGNMISDFVKGKNRFEYSIDVQKGIILHRQIDAFTDFHAATKEAKMFLKPAVGLYSGPFIDVAYDHFLANDRNEFTDVTLRRKAENTYDILNANYSMLPSVFQKIFPYMKEQNWLYNYKSTSGTQSSFGGLARRAKYLNNSDKVFELFQKHYNELRECYNAFFPFVKAFVIEQIEQLTNG